MVSRIEAALQRLILEELPSDLRGNSLREWAMQTLRFEDELHAHIDQYVRLRVALSLCPKSALTHRKSERVSRFEKIESHLKVQGVDADDACVLATAVDRVVDSWLTGRESVANYRTALVERDGSQCRACRVDLSLPHSAIASVVTRDRFKLTWIKPDEALQYSVDHREPVSRFGTNELSNLEILCKFCNTGKADGSPMLLKHEVEYSILFPIDDYMMTEKGIISKSSALVYRVLARDGFKCCICGFGDNELTVRKTIDSGLAIVSNMDTVCYRCLSE
ncbi:HNH endonuclease [Gordonia sp. NPDC062954]|uniref:HNH endonuclease n=1 Tax=Gordonia sp. NPDC062954 TaxID=3364003 RepID=UPI0037CB7DB6